MRRIHFFLLTSSFLLLLFGCAKQRLPTPSPVGVSGGIGRVQSGVTSAQAQHGQIARANVEARSNLQRADNKQVLIDAWKKWKQTHP